jgi:hypothetical protein
MFGAPVPALDGLRAERADAEADADDPLQDDGEEGRAERVVVGDAAAGAEGSAAQDARRSFDLAVDAQALRARQSRQALVEQAGLDADGQQALDDLVLNMNHRLADHADELVDLVLSEEEPTSSELLGVSHDVTGILYEAQTRLEELVGDDALGEVDPEASQVWNHLDLETLRPAMERAEKNGLLGGAGAP